MIPNMPYKILEKARLNSITWKMKLDAPVIAKSAKAGQFVVVMIDEKGERVPLTISDLNIKSGTITIIFQEVGKTTKKLGCLKVNDHISNLLGPLGKPADFGRAGKVILVGGGVGIAEILPIARYAKDNKNYVLTIIGSRAKEFLILEDELKKYSDELVVTTDDGSYGTKSLVIRPLEEAIAKERFDLCYVVGPDIMMKAASDVTRPCGLKTLVSLDANMVDATGMCATCRVSVGGVTKFACVDGPEFDGHLVDWDGFMKRQKRFKDEEKVSVELFQSQHKECMYRG